MEESRWFHKAGDSLGMVDEYISFAEMESSRNTCTEINGHCPPSVQYGSEEHGF